MESPPPPWRRRMLRRWPQHLVAVGVLLGCAILIAPNEQFERPIRRLLGEPEPLVDVFSDDLAALDAKLQAGQAVELPEGALLELQLRRLAKLGPMSVDELRRARAILVDSSALIASERTPASRQAQRSLRAKRLAAALDRLPQARISATLATLERQAGLR